MKRFRIQQTDLLIAAAETGRTINVKKGWFGWYPAEYNLTWGERFPISWCTLAEAEKQLAHVIGVESFVPKSHRDVTI